MGIAEELERLQALREGGALSPEEFERAKARVLGASADLGAAADSGAGTGAAFFRQLARSRSDRLLGGVCGGLGRHTDIPSWAWRLIFCLVTLYFGSGILFYVLLWIFLEAVLGPGPLLVPHFPLEMDIPELPGESLTLYPLRHTTGLGPHPYRNEVLTTIENEAGSRLVHAHFDGGQLVTFTQGVFAGGVTDDPPAGRDARPGATRDPRRRTHITSLLFARRQVEAYTSERGGINDEEPVVQEVVFSPQLYGEIYAQRLSDGYTVRITHNKWEDGTVFWLPPAD